MQRRATACLLLALLAFADDGPEALRVRRPATAQDRRPWIGVTLSALEGDTSAIGGAKGELGILVTSVVAGAPAEKAGLAAEDVLVAIDGRPFEGSGEEALEQLRVAIAKRRPGDALPLVFLRGGERISVTVTLAEMPIADARGKPHPELEAYHNDPAPSYLELVLAKEKLDQGFTLVEQGVAAAASESATTEPILSDDPDPFRLGEVNYCLTHPLDTHLVVKGLARDLADAAERGSSPAVLMAALAREADLEVGAIGARPLAGESLDARVDDLVARIAEAVEDVKAALAPLRPEERRELAEASFFRPGDRGSAAGLQAYLALGARVKRDRLAAAACRVLAALGKTSLEALGRDAGISGQVEPPEGVEGDVLLIKETHAGTVVVGGKGRTVYARAFALVIDLGGNDVYEGACAAGEGLDLPVSVVVDLSGDDTYRSTQPYTQGSGHLGVGILIDAAGDDVYSADAYAQGSGHVGVGVLIDLDGADTLRADLLSQGSGVMGIGAVVDLEGSDVARVSRQGQGHGAVGGVGLLFDGSGDDARFAGGAYRDEDGIAQSMAQGFGVGYPPSKNNPYGASGGVGLLVDLLGNDTYVADDLCHGTGYWFGLGGLYDARGVDRYVAARFAQGAGVVNGAGALVEGEGDDAYDCALVGLAQGCGHGRAVGVLADYAGKDSYHAGTVSQGAGNEGGIGVLIDFGGNDSMYAKADSQGRGGATEARKTASFGLIFNVGGTDLYSIGGERSANDKQTVTRPNWGLLMDVEDKIRVR